MLPAITPLREIDRAVPTLASQEAEQALLGALLLSNQSFDRCSGIVDPGDFSLGVHGRIFDAIGKLIERGTSANPVTLQAMFDQDEALLAIGGSKYLLDLARSAVTIIGVPDYAKIIADLAQRRRLIVCCRETIEEASDMSIDVEAVDVITKHEEEVFALAEKRRTGFMVSIGEAARAAIEQTEGAYKRGGGLAGVSTGLADLDRMLGGLLAGNLILLAGRPSMGKSALAAQIGKHAASHGTPTAIFSLEQTASELAQREMAQRSGVETGKQRRGELDGNDWTRLLQAAEEVERIPLYIDETPGLSIGTIRQRARRERRRHGIGLVIVDHLQLVQVAGKSEGRRLEIGQITRTLKALAKEIGIPVLLLSQLNRAVELRDPPRPQMPDLRESGDIEQDADCVMFIYRQEYYLARQEPQQREKETSEAFAERYGNWEERLARAKGGAEIIIEKARHGRTGSVHLHWDPERLMFSGFARSW